MRSGKFTRQREWFRNLSSPEVVPAPLSRIRNGIFTLILYNKKHKKMKKLILTLMLLAGLTTMAQTGHMTFKGVPIDGNLNTVVSKLKQKGFTLLHLENGSAMLSGDFASFKNCTVGVFEHESGIVNRIAVMFPDKDTWVSLYNDYNKLKNMLIEKYGEPASVEEVFQNQSSYGFDDSDRMYEVLMDRCRYICDWVTESGSIELRIAHNIMVGCFVVLVYIDAENEAKVHSSAIEDL